MSVDRAEIDRRYFVDTAARTMELLRVVAEAPAPISLTGMVEALGWSKPAVYRLVRTLETVGALRQHEGRAFVAGPALITLGQAAMRATLLPEIARPHLERLFEQVGETVVLTILDGDEVIYLDRIEADKLLIPRTRLGSRLPAYATSTGKVLLAGLDDEEVRRRVAHRSFVQLGPQTVSSVEQLLERLKDVRRDGYDVNDEELAVGHRSAAAPVYDHAGAVVGAVSVSVPSARISLEQLAGFVSGGLLRAAEAISADLGARADG